MGGVWKERERESESARESDLKKDKLRFLSIFLLLCRFRVDQRTTFTSVFIKDRLTELLPLLF